MKRGFGALTNNNHYSAATSCKALAEQLTSVSVPSPGTLRLREVGPRLHGQRELQLQPCPQSPHGPCSVGLLAFVYLSL